MKRLYHTFEDSRNLLLEGANIVLMRYFGLRRYRGNIRTETVLMNGMICESIYVSRCFILLFTVMLIKVEAVLQNIINMKVV